MNPFKKLLSNHIFTLVIGVIAGFWLGTMSVVIYAEAADLFETETDITETAMAEQVADVRVVSQVEPPEMTAVAEPTPVPTPSPSPEPPPYRLRDHFGEANIVTPDGTELTYLTLPTAYYPSIDFSYFKAWMPYTVLGRNNQCGRIAYSDQAFTDENGLRRYSLGPDDFTTNGQADYLVAMGTFYKPKGTVGQRYLIVTPTGSYTVRTSDELADVHSDPHHMFSRHGRYACVLEFLIDSQALAGPAKRMGTVSALGGMLGEEIIAIYLIG